MTLIFVCHGTGYYSSHIRSAGVDLEIVSEEKERVKVGVSRFPFVTVTVIVDEAPYHVAIFIQIALSNCNLFLRKRVRMVENCSHQETNKLTNNFFSPTVKFTNYFLSKCFAQ